jgi:hypothetical protein
MPKREDMEKGNVRFGTMDFSDEPYLTQYKWPTLLLTAQVERSYVSYGLPGRIQWLIFDLRHHIGLVEEWLLIR